MEGSGGGGQGPRRHDGERGLELGSQANLRMIAENDMELVGCRQVLLGTDRTGSMDICVGLDLVIEAQKQISLKVGASGIVIDPSVGSASSAR